MIVKVVPLAAQDGIAFDLILDTGYVKQFTLSDYELRAYRASVADVIEATVLQWLAENDYQDDEVSIIYC